ncbi:MAG: hypothetical protein P1V81_00505 [Planctomycetota bacterium]|nr:hypothetical protein [Planctomycetota bacterium]
MSASPEPKGLAALVARIDDRLNPVLVKEVRQALRGKQFRSSFGFTLTISAIVAVSIVLGSAPRAEWVPIGPPFFIGVFSCLAVAVIGFVPMAAFQSMGSEWDENTYDMLSLSHLRPRHIVLGKLLSAGIQALLYFSVFGFFSVFTFLLGGVDLSIVMVAIPLLAVISLALSSVAVGLSSLSQKRMVRVVLMVVLSAGLVGAIFGSIGMVVQSVEFSIDFSLPEVQAAISGMLVSSFVLGGLFFVLACSRLAHPEENRSTGLRVFGFALVLVGMYWIGWLFEQIGQAEVIGFLSCGVVLAVTLVGTFFTTEREALGRRVAVHLPSNNLARFALLPWLPGGGRGTLWVLGMHGLTLAWAWMLLNSLPSATSLTGITMIAPADAHENFGLVLTAVSYSLIYLMVPSALRSNRTAELKPSMQARVAIPVLFLAGMLLPAILGFMVGDRDLAEAEHIGNPFWALDRISRIGDEPFLGSLMGPILILAGLALVLQLPRVVRAILEVLRAPRLDGNTVGLTVLPDGTIDELPIEDLDDEAGVQTK